MANVKISELPVAASVDGASSFPVVEGGVTKQVTFTGMLASPSLFASGMATFFATPSSANLRAALTDETGTGAAVFADSPTLVGPTVSSGNVTFSGTAQRITGDFSNATLASRVMFQTSTVNGNSTPALIPNGTATTAGLLAINNSDPTNASFAAVLSLSGVMQVASGITGTGTYLPMAFLTGGAERVRVDTSGNVGIGTNAPTEKLEVHGTAAGSAFAVRFSNTSSTANSAAVLSLDPGNNGFNVRDGQIRAINNGANQISLAFFTSSAATPAEAMRLDPSGNLIAKVNAAAPSLSTNSTMSFELTSNTSLKIVVRGSDGVTRSVSLTLA